MARENGPMGGEIVDESVRGVPAPPLRGLVGWYSGYRQRGIPHGRHRGLPSPWLTLIITLDEPLTIAAHPDPGAAGGDYPTLLGGLHLTPALIEIPGRQSGIQVALSPLGARVLLGLPAGELAGTDLHADDVLGACVREVHDEVREAADWAARFAVVDDWLMRRMSLHDRPGPAPAAPVAGAWQRLLAAGGRLRVDKLAADTGVSERHLRNRFRAEIGLTPKAAARVIRFDLARRRLASRPGRPDLAGLAADCGYADQSHLDREFAALASCTPSDWLAQEFRNIQSGHCPPA
ncbi:helix-turn-helix domain-containing protein [Streptomyces sp. NBC_00201]|uniref:AraC family transcriptional regulator n=1 Tax=unclassified Streptomyces TaxID=2593676 RepID=UPI00225BBF3B|nr:MULTISPECIES: helix-turn-helix domain-containing protein [unclassified Streptomyces]MCX5243903.1 helix-turn-helix domain-containing protein [Streptomyces sp. NBC_00201]